MTLGLKLRKPAAWIHSDHMHVVIVDDVVAVPSPIDCDDGDTMPLAQLAGHSSGSRAGNVTNGRISEGYDRDMHLRYRSAPNALKLGRAIETDDGTFGSRKLML